VRNFPSAEKKHSVKGAQCGLEYSWLQWRQTGLGSSRAGGRSQGFDGTRIALQEELDLLKIPIDIHSEHKTQSERL
jgi:hypothetical protein